MLHDKHLFKENICPYFGTAIFFFKINQNKLRG